MQVENYRLQNIYDLSTSSRQFLFKFAIPDSKKLVVVDPGYRIHGTDYARSTAQTPSGFVAKLRKHLRTRRLNKIRIAPQNRLLVFSFSDEHSFHLVFEFFAGGNMLLLDKDFKILSLQRVVSASDTKTRCAVGEIYPLQDYLNATDTSIKEFSTEMVKSWLQGDGGDDATYDNENEDNRDQENPLQQGQTNKKGVGQKKKALTIKKLLFIKAPGIATGLIESALISRGLDPGILSTDTEKLSFAAIADAMNEAKTKSDELVANTPVKGYILGKLNPKFDKEKYERQQKVVQAPEVNAIDPHNIEYLYEEFQPFEPRIPEQESEKYKLIETKSYGQAVDIYFSTIEATKLALKTANQEQVAEKRLNAAKAEKDKRVQGLTDVQEKSELLGSVLETNAHLVEEAANAVKGLLQQGMDWKDIEKLIQVEKSRNNPVAEIIHLPLNLIKNKISVVLPEPGQGDDEDDDDEKVKKVKVEIDLGLSAWANASSYFDVKKTAAAKQERTIKQADHAYKNAEKKIKKDLQQALDKEKNQQTMHSIREPFWFEKFFWFLSSDGYLVLGGRDSMQNELLFRRHFKQNDIYVHSDVEGTCVVIIKNHISGSKVVPPGTLSQAGALCLASSSKVWESKMNPSAWWATRDQIPKISQGDIVTTDRVVVRGEGKHHLPPTQMDMGFGFLWLVGDDAKENYSKNVPEGLISGPGEESKQEAGFLEEEAAPPAHREADQETLGEAEEEKKETPNTDGHESSDEEEFPDTQIPDEEDLPKEQKEEDRQKESSVEPESTRSSTPEIKTGNRKLSAKERRDLKKKRKTGNIADDDDGDASSSSAAVQDIEKTLDDLKMDNSKGGSKKEKAGGGEQKPPKVRGKKGKMKKMATKYADQDEEDRQKRMELLGTTKGLERAKAQAEEEKRKKEEYERQRKEKERRKKEAEMRRLQDEENDETPETVFPFNTLVPRLVPGDTPLGAVPVFGPWASLQKLKYRIKLQPGSTKKGKAVREMLHFFTHQKVDQEEKDPESPWQSEVDLISSLKETELLLPIAISKVKPVLPNSGNKSNQKNKGKGKK